MEFDDLLLDDVDRLIEADTRDLLLMTASAGASMRAAALLVEPATLERQIQEGRPRTVLVVGGGGSRAAGDILAAIAGNRSPVPVVTVSGPALPGWVGPTDLVFAVSGSGATSETLSVAGEAARRGCRLVSVCPSKSPLAELTSATRGGEAVRVGIPPIAGKWRARTLMWSLATPLLLIGGALGLVEDAEDSLDRAAARLDEIADECSPTRELVANHSKRMAVELATSLPLLWGTGPVGAVAARRFGRQLAENAGLPTVVGTLPEAARTQAALMSGPLAGQVDEDDIFRDRIAEPDPSARLRLILLRDSDEHPSTAALADAAVGLANSRKVPVEVLRAQGLYPLERLADLVGRTDFAAIYAGLALGIDPMSSKNELDARRDGSQEL